MRERRCARRGDAAFTVLELVIALLIVAILSTLLLPVYAHLRERGQRVECVANLRNLYIGADLFLQRNGSWPQIRRTNSETGTEEFANAWIAALTPFGLSRRSWICPTIQGLLHNPDYAQPRQARLDYIPMNFDANALTPHKWPRQPWFIETGDVHGNGNLIIFTDGSIGETNDIARK